MATKHGIAEEEEAEVGPSPKRACRTRSVDGCTNHAKGDGNHGGGRPICNHDGCTNLAQRFGICTKHGGKHAHKTCSHEGCTNFAVRGGVCYRHGAKRPTCSRDGCTNNVVRGGVCIRHGAYKTPSFCSHDGCTNIAQKGGSCIRHGAVVKLCSTEGCTNAKAVDRQVEGAADARGETENRHVSTAPIDRDHTNSKEGDSLNGDVESNKQDDDEVESMAEECYKDLCEKLTLKLEKRKTSCRELKKENRHLREENQELKNEVEMLKLKIKNGQCNR